jgi:hypothetical protein
LHQEIAITEGSEKTVVSVAVYRDALPAEALEGTGQLAIQDREGLPIVVDPGTGVVRMSVRGFSGSGLRASWTQQWTPMIAAYFEAGLGSALAIDGPLVALKNAPGAVHARTAQALSGGVTVNARSTGTALNVGYRWQPRATLTPVDEFDTPLNEAYLGATLRQRLWSGQRLKGVSAVVEATNLLQQGYEPLLGADGQTLYLAQVPRALQAGLAFSF